MSEDRIRLDTLDDMPDTPSPRDAVDIIELAGKLTVFKQMYFFMKCGLHNPHGTMVLCQINDGSKAQLAINSKNLVELLKPEFEAVGKTLEENGIVTATMLEQVDAQYASLYSRSNQ